MAVSILVVLVQRINSLPTRCLRSNLLRNNTFETLKQHSMTGITMSSIYTLMFIEHALCYPLMFIEHVLWLPVGFDTGVNSSHK